MNSNAFRFLTVIVALVFSLQLAATVKPLSIPKENRMVLSDYAGKKTFFEVMTTKKVGIKDRLDALNESTFTLADLNEATHGFRSFSKKVKGNVLRDITTDDEERKEDVFGEIVDELAGKTFTPPQLKAALKKKGARPWAIADYLMMASGAALLVHLDSQNYYYNVSYFNDDVNKGRSFGAGPSHPADDASYPFYLRNFQVYLENVDDLSPFYRAVLAILTESDPSKMKEVDSESIEAEFNNVPVTVDGQTLVTDFVTIYTAELYRHVISALERHDWENALAELTFVSAFSQKEGVVQKENNTIVKGNATDWRYVGEEGSGIGGRAGRQRRLFQQKVCKAARALALTSLQKIDAITGKRDDCFNGVMRFLNNYKTQDAVKKSADKLSAAVVEFLSDIRKRSKEVAKKIPGIPAAE
ncbi:MAG: hypothetical protein HY537_00245 [Deltaproteobacteria bacterium]|nr:hypothetical protein [Deltaproteobacteria bacterium]